MRFEVLSNRGSVWLYGGDSKESACSISMRRLNLLRNDVKPVFQSGVAQA